ncbi:MAG: RNase adapter RapZ [Clostridiales bacterium]|jgi:UPF0042 nucleotide-binding protein|nr:RNase adapter RapZ [Clostridiales bacterium]
MELLIVSGMSGAGKSSALKFLEDLGFFCVDNIIPRLIPEVIDACEAQGNIKLALSADIRGREFFDELYTVLDLLKIKGVGFKILFLDADSAVLINRYKESRRSHPLETQGLTAQAIERERLLLAEIRGRAEVVDTSNLSQAELKRRIFGMFAAATPKAAVTLVSFGFKRGSPPECDMLLDVRFLPNPYNDAALRPRNGLDRAVADYVFSASAGEEFCVAAAGLVGKMLPAYLTSVKTPLVVGIGCTGGKHRSAAVAARLAAILEEHDIKTDILHRDIYID